MARRKTLEETICDFKKVHGNKYDYSKVHYKNTLYKVEIICPEHGSFWMTPSDHKNGSGCKVCAFKKNTFTEKEIINKFKKIHSYKYNYSKVVYKNIMTKVKIICPEHGEFIQQPLAHLSGSGCPDCNPRRIKNKELYIKEFKKVHEDKYNYQKFNFKTISEKIEIICPEHGSFFQLISNHRVGIGCPKCSGMNKTTEEILKEFKKAHNDKYDYSKVNYINTNTKVEIICPEHGSFFQQPMAHKNGVGCPKCSESKGERRVREFLEENNIEYSQEVKLFDKYRFDFYIEDLNTVIEYDGKQHYESIDYFGGIKGFLRTQERDKIKTVYCLENNIKLIRIPYWDFNIIEKILKGELCQI